MSDRCQTGCGNRQAFQIWFQSASVVKGGQSSPGMQWSEVVCKACADPRKQQVAKEGGHVVSVKVLPEPTAPPVWAPELEPVAAAVESATESPAPPSEPTVIRRRRARGKGNA
jgi:hypothetical protein